MSLTIKSTYNKVIKRITTKPAPRSFEELRNLIQMQHGVPADFKMTYMDEEGDKITLSTDMDLQEAIRVAKTQKNLLKVSVLVARKRSTSPKQAAKKYPKSVPKKPDAPRAPPPFTSGIPSFFNSEQIPSFVADMMSNPQQMMAMLPLVIDQVRPFIPMIVFYVESNSEVKKMLNDLLDSDLVRVEQAYDCDYCDTEISGTRLRCTVCPNFDLCSSCHSAHGAKHAHEFQPVTALDAILEYLKNGGDPMVFAQAYLAKGKADDNARKASVTHNAICDGCEGTIVGVRHRCLQCQDFDFCSACVDSGRTHAHQLFQIPTIEEADASAYRVARDQYQAEKQAAEQRAVEAVAAAKEERAAEERARLLAEDELLRAVRESEEIERQVKSQLKATDQSVTAPKPKPLNAFERNLLTLEQMGFSDRSLCIRELVRNRNELIPTIQALLK